MSQGRRVLIGLTGAILASGIACAGKLKVPEGGVEPASERATPRRPEDETRLPQAIAPKVFPAVPPPDAAAADVPSGYKVEVALLDLVYPTSVEFDDKGNLYVAEAGYSYGDPVALARVLRVSPAGKISRVADQLSGPVTDLLWDKGKLYISHRGKVSVLEGSGLRDLVTDLPAQGDHQNNQLAIGPDGKLYFGMGTVTNSGVVGLDNVSPFLWLLFYPDLHDIPARDLELADVSYTTPDPLTVLARQGELVSFSAATEHLVSPSEPLLVKTGPFQPFGKTNGKVKGQVKANGTILRVNPDGTGLEVFAWGLRNPFGVAFAPDGRLYATENGYDERGSRPIANAPDCIWLIKQGAFYGFPDFAGGVPVTDPQFRSSRGLQPTFLMKEHPPVEKPVRRLPPHSAATKIDFGKSGAFGFEGQMFFGEIGGAAPINNPKSTNAGYQVARLDLTSSAEPVRFFGLRAEALGQAGYEHTVTPGPRRPVDVKFSPDGSTLYVVDFGGLAAFPAGAGPLAHPYPGSGVLWRVYRSDAKPWGPPPDLSPAPPLEQ